MPFLLPSDEATEGQLRRIAKRVLLLSDLDERGTALERRCQAHVIVALYPDVNLGEHLHAIFFRFTRVFLVI